MTTDPTPAVPLDDPTEARLAAATTLWGEKEVTTRAVALVGGYNAGDEFLLYVGGRHAQGILDGAPVLYWPELWGTRALLYVWDDSATEAVGAALVNQAWRVREMAARVVAVRNLDFAAVLVGLLTDEVARVRAASARALGAVGSLEIVDDVRPLLKDPEIDVRRAAQQGIAEIRGRHAESPHPEA